MNLSCSLTTIHNLGICTPIRLNHSILGSGINSSSAFSISAVITKRLSFNQFHPNLYLISHLLYTEGNVCQKSNFTWLSVWLDVIPMDKLPVSALPPNLSPCLFQGSSSMQMYSHFQPMTCQTQILPPSSSVNLFNNGNFHVPYYLVIEFSCSKDSTPFPDFLCNAAAYLDFRTSYADFTVLLRLRNLCNKSIVTWRVNCVVLDKRFVQNPFSRSESQSGCRQFTLPGCDCLPPRISMPGCNNWYWSPPADLWVKWLLFNFQSSTSLIFLTIMDMNTMRQEMFGWITPALQIFFRFVDDFIFCLAWYSYLNFIHMSHFMAHGLKFTLAWLSFSSAFFLRASSAATFALYLVVLVLQAYIVENKIIDSNVSINTIMLMELY